MACDDVTGSTDPNSGSYYCMGQLCPQYIRRCCRDRSVPWFRYGVGRTKLSPPYSARPHGTQLLSWSGLTPLILFIDEFRNKHYFFCLTGGRNCRLARLEAHVRVCTSRSRKCELYSSCGPSLPLHLSGPFLYEQRETAPPWSVGWLANSTATAMGQHTDDPFSGPRGETAVRDVTSIAQLLCLLSGISATCSAA